MAGRHLKALLLAHRDRDDLAFRRAATALIEEEEAKRHTALARDLRRLMASGGGAGTMSFSDIDVPLPEPPKDRDSALPLADMHMSDRQLDDLTLDPELKLQLSQLLTEVSNWETLDTLGIPRRNRVLLYGPPGCGKTSIAEAMASELGRVLVTIRVESVISSFLGETASNLRRLFEFASEGPYVVLFDEFDSLAKDRDDPSDHGELRRIVNAVLQLIDRYQGPSMIIAATNHGEVLDNAMWRRFDEVLEVAPPTTEQRYELLARSLSGRSVRALDLADAVTSLDGLPHAAVERTVHTALRTAVAAGRMSVSQADLTAAVAAVTSRRWA
ncbi:AAA family ATPase [Nocardioides sp. NPDC059952]|uniref:AAA family ATPase n=1 Tax=Nocardioides sp. NPDC059952 TaxID=3347014 RepID=UPI00365A6DF6